MIELSEKPSCEKSHINEILTTRFLFCDPGLPEGREGENLHFCKTRFLLRAAALERRQLKSKIRRTELKFLIQAAATAQYGTISHN
jgi:hypothetical protein